MKNKYVFVLVLLVVILAAGAGLAALIVSYQSRDGAESDEAELTVVTSFYPMYIAADNVVGDCEGVRLENLSEPQTGCLHDYQLTTEDMELLSTADVFVINGGGIENFLSRAAEQYPDLTIVDACEGIELIDGNPHVWMSVENYMRQVQNICDGLTSAAVEAEAGADMADTAETAGSAAAETFRINTEGYLSKLEDLEDECADLADELAGQPVILFHEAYEYLAEELGLAVAGEMDLDEERQVGAREVAQILSLIETEGVPVIFAEELYAKDMGDRMEEETDVTVIYLDPLTRGDYDADSYLDGMRENLQLIREAYSN